MINIGWLEGLLNSVADRGRELIGIHDDTDNSNHTDKLLCKQLVQGKGEATNIALAREILRHWLSKSEEQKLDLLLLLSSEFDCDKTALKEAAIAFDPDDNSSYQRLIKAASTPRQELFRRLNMAPNGTSVLVAMRAFLLQKMPQNPQLKNVDIDFQQILSAWFNRGFLQLERIDWHSSASILEKLIEYEAVHPIQGWDDLRRRLHDKDRRCYAFFHPALPDVPLIFVEVALTNEISSDIENLLNINAPVNTEQAPDTAIFYSINNALVGLRGVSFGNFLIKKVAEELKEEFKQILTFSTLSPIPLMVKTFSLFLDPSSAQYPADKKSKVLADLQQMLKIKTDKQDEAKEQSGLSIDELEQYIRSDSKALHKVCLYYLNVLKQGDAALDPVANFHLSNGARLHSINTQANLSDRGISESWGCMVNYLYEDETVVTNHESYVCDGNIALSKELQRDYKQLLSDLQ
jgi:malonyl-CoA decarboxylase